MNSSQLRTGAHSLEVSQVGLNLENSSESYKYQNMDACFGKWL